MKIADKQKLYDAGAAVLIAVLFCLPMYSGMIRSGSDTAFHMARMLQLSEALRHGDLYPRIFPEMHMGFGYGSPLFYSVCLLYPAALLILGGIPLLMAWRINIFIIVFAASLAFITFVRPMCRHRWTPVFSAALCMLNPYVLANCYKRGALGEMLAMVFLPVVLCGIRELFFRKKNGTAAVAAGFCGLILSHNISFVLAMVLLGIFCALNLRRKNIRRIVPQLFLGLFTAFLLTAFFTLPMLEQLQTHLYRISGYFGEISLADSACSLKEFFLFGLDDDVMMCVCPGLCALLGFGALLTGSRMQKQCFGIGVVMMFCATKLFPWKYLPWFSFMQFPARFLTPAVILMSAASAAVIDLILLRGRRQLKIALPAVMILFVIVHDVQLYGNWGSFHDDLSIEKIFDEKRIFGERAWYNRMELSSPDYLPQHTAVDYYAYDRAHAHCDGQTAELERSYGKLVFTAQNDGYWVVPKTFYTGYRAVVLDENGKKTGNLPVSMDPETGLVRIEVTGAPAQIRVYYGITVIQVLSDLLTLGGIVLSILFFYERRLNSSPSTTSTPSRIYGLLRIKELPFLSR
ncbi:MAG: hypothetical protein IKF51_06055 [Solobacterium sp.]|nr:hypothetical protein [Solobacterium sp.]